MSHPIDFVMPSLGADMDEGTVTEWLVNVGDRVSRGDVVAVVETDKADLDIEVWDDGLVTEILVGPGRLVPVGTPLARLTVEGEADETAAPVLHIVPPIAGTEPEPEPGLSPADEPRPSVAAAAPAATIAASAAPPSSPLARRIAAEQGIDLAGITGTGPDGAVVVRDLGGLDRHPSATTPATESRAGTDRMRRAIGDLMSRANREIPHYHLATEIDLESALVWLEADNAERALGDRVLPAALLLRATALSLAANPELNGFWVGNRFVPGDGIHLGVAISLRGKGLVAPAIRDADRLDLDATMAALSDLVSRARAGRLRSSEVMAPTITVTNLGDRGVELVHGVIHPPQVALLGFGRIVRRPAVVDDAVVPRRLVVATLAADHRASDGQRGSRLLTDLERRLNRPEELR